MLQLPNTWKVISRCSHLNFKQHALCWVYIIIIHIMPTNKKTQTSWFLLNLSRIFTPQFARGKIEICLWLKRAERGNELRVASRLPYTCIVYVYIIIIMKACFSFKKLCVQDYMYYNMPPATF